MFCHLLDTLLDSAMSGDFHTCVSKMVEVRRFQILYFYIWAIAYIVITVCDWLEHEKQTVELVLFRDQVFCLFVCFFP